MTSKIENIKARQIFDSRGNPTIEVDIFSKHKLSVKVLAIVECKIVSIISISFIFNFLSFIFNLSPSNKFDFEIRVN